MSGEALPVEANPTVDGFGAAFDGARLATVVFDEGAARIVNPDGDEIVVPQRPSASGFWYESPTHSLRGQGSELVFTIRRMAPIMCRQDYVESM